MHSCSTSARSQQLVASAVERDGLAVQPARPAQLARTPPWSFVQRAGMGRSISTFVRSLCFLRAHEMLSKTKENRRRKESDRTGLIAEGGEHGDDDEERGIVLDVCEECGARVSTRIERCRDCWCTSARSFHASSSSASRGASDRSERDDRVQHCGSSHRYSLNYAVVYCGSLIGSRRTTTTTRRGCCVWSKRARARGRRGNRRGVGDGSPSRGVALEGC